MDPNRIRGGLDNFLGKVKNKGKVKSLEEKISSYIEKAKDNFGTYKGIILDTVYNISAISRIGNYMRKQAKMLEEQIEQLHKYGLISDDEYKKLGRRIRIAQASGTAFIIVGIGAILLGIGGYLLSHDIYSQPENNIQININEHINNTIINDITINGSHGTTPPQPVTINGSYSTTPPQPEQISEYQTFGTNSSMVILQVKSVTQISNQYALLTVYNPYKGTYQFIQVPINESYFELTNGSAISIDNALPKLPKGEYSYLLIGINNPNNITESGIYYIGEINGTPVVSLSENANIGYMITNASPNQLANYLTAAMNGQAKTLMLTGYGVFNDSKGLWGWDNATKQSVIVNFPSSSAVNYANQMVELSDSILGTNTTNPGQYGVIPMVIIENPNVSQQGGYTVYNLSSNDYIDIILLTPHQGQQLESKILNR